MNAKEFRALRSSTKGLAFGIHDLLKKVVENFICPLYFSSLYPFTDSVAAALFTGLSRFLISLL